jgi:hypothetical protein
MVLVRYNNLICIYGFLCWFSINASVTSSTEERKSKTVILMEKGKMYLQLNQFTKKVLMGSYFFLLFSPLQSKLVFATLFFFSLLL